MENALRGRRASFAICAWTAKICFCLESCGVQASILQSSGVVRSSNSKRGFSIFQKPKVIPITPPDRDCLEKPEENKQQLKNKTHLFLYQWLKLCLSLRCHIHGPAWTLRNTEKSFQKKKNTIWLCNFWESKCIDLYQSAMNQSCV